MQIKGTFEIQMTPEAPYSTDDGISIGRVHFEKRFSGELEATSIGDMIGVRGPVATSGGYVCIERVTGTLAGKRGSFVLQHNGVMDRGNASLSCTVVPDTATGELAGLRGKLAIDIVDKRHHYTFDYELI
jgi:Protein of unknown function (DUF3224)